MNDAYIALIIVPSLFGESLGLCESGSDEKGFEEIQGNGEINFYRVEKLVLEERGLKR